VNKEYLNLLKQLNSQIDGNITTLQNQTNDKVLSLLRGLEAIEDFIYQDDYTFDTSSILQTTSKQRG